MRFLRPALLLAYFSTEHQVASLKLVTVDVMETMIFLKRD